MIVAAAALAVVSGCAGTADRTPVTVFAAASLHESFAAIAEAFEAENDDIDIRPIVTDGSNVLVTQLEAGARADVIATADERTMDRIAGLVGDPEIFATNTLVVVAPAGGPARELSELGDDRLRVVLCAPEVPCGAASAQLLEAAGVTVTPASEEQNVTAVLTKVESGEADAGLVYRSDTIDRDVVVTEPPEGGTVVNRYPIGVLAGAEEPAAAERFVAYVAGSEGREILAEHGFGAP